MRRVTDHVTAAEAENPCGTGDLRLLSREYVTDHVTDFRKSNNEVVKMQDGFLCSCIFRHKQRKEPTFLQVLVELMTRFELVTSSLPRMRSTD